MQAEMRPPAIFADGVSVTVTLYAGSFLTAEDQAWRSLLGHLDPPERATLRSPAVRDLGQGRTVG